MLCRWGQQHGVRVPLSSEHRDAISAENELMAGEALRVLGVAYRPAASAVTPLLINEITNNPKGRLGGELIKKTASGSDSGVRMAAI